MNDVLYMVLSFIAGLILGTLFFWGLWFTVKKMVDAKKPALLFLPSLFFRVSITLIGFYYVSLGNWQRLLICLLGFITARYIIIHRTKSGKIKQTQLKKEAGYEAQP
jgi:F1F0 ATPase subunit 2